MSDAPIVPTTTGRIRGRSDGSVNAFLGIPYAAAPVGARRWAAPEPPAPWSGVRAAAAFGAAAPQPERPIGLWSHGPTPVTAEDCLSLNVWTPAAPAAAGRPVLVWIHGGGWALGFSGSEAFDGGRLAAAADAIVVTLNYRLGSLGWLNHPELGANWGLRDQALALTWVRDNIDAFGGDPTAVTLSGQSAGAGSALHLLASPLGEGLFRQVIAQSPPMGELTVPTERGHAWFQALSESLTGGAGDIDALRAAPADRVVETHEALLVTPAFRGTRGGAMPVPDPDTMPADPRAVPGARPALPVLIGTTADEATFLFRAARRLDPDDAHLRAMVAHLPDVSGAEAADELIGAARADGGADSENVAVLCRLATQQLFAGPVAQWAHARGDAGGDVYRYRVEHVSPRPELGATHTIDVPLLFGTHGTEVGARVAGSGPAADAVSAVMMRAWREFIHGRAPWDPEQLEVFG
jgi:para-nitrobenzyl esterase